MQKIQLKTNNKNELIDITNQINSLIDIDEGICLVFCPHTTAGITINENADYDVQIDLLKKLKEISQDNSYRHMEGNSDAHLVSSMMGCSKTLIISNNKLQLGTWQSVYFIEFDGARNREVWIKTIKE